MAYSSIKIKCKCGCHRVPTMSCFGYNYNCLPPDLREKAGTKKALQIKNQNTRKAISSKVRNIPKEDSEYSLQELWYISRRHLMTGYCTEEGCHSSTNKNNDTYYRWSVCHIVPKKLIPSVATHPDNWIELCWQHHSEFDSTFDKAAKMKCFPEAKRKFELFRHLIPKEEMRKINHWLTLSPSEQSVSRNEINNQQSEGNED